MTCKTLAIAATLAVWALASTARGADAEPPYLFNVLNHRSVALTAQYWNPILLYVSRKSGVPLELRLNRTSRENTAIAETGVYHFLYTNHFFTPERDRLGFKVIARPAGPGIRAQIVVNKESPIQSLRDLEGKEVAFPTPDGFTGYWLPMDALLRSKVNVKSVFSGNQEASFSQVRIDKVSAAGVNSVALETYARRENYEYRVLWTSELYGDLCIMANPKVPADRIAAVRSVLIDMVRDPEGRKVLEASAALLKMQGELGFVPVDNRDYENYRTFYKTTRVKDQSKE